MMKKIWEKIAAAALLLAGAGTGHAATYVLSGYASSAGGAATANFFGTSDGPYTVQQIGLSASTLAQKTGALPIGAIVTGVALRLASYSATVTSDITFDQFDVRIGTSATSTATLARNFADNYGSDTILARSGALTIAGGTLKGAGKNSPRPGTFYEFNFTTPYTYVGGDLLVTMATHLTSAIAVNTLYLDGLSSVGYDKVNFDTSFNSATPPTRGTVGFAYQPVLELIYSLPAAVPEPTTWFMSIAGFACVGASLRRKRPGLAIA